ncbi:PQQ-binding-like beta-propeller repeat protein [Bacillaceae bacterium S4-13-56]
MRGKTLIIALYLVVLFALVGVTIWNLNQDGESTQEETSNQTEKANSDDETTKEEQNNNSNQEDEGNNYEVYTYQEYTRSEAPAFTGEELFDLPTKNWITNGGNVRNERYSPLDQINADNIADLKAEWVTSLGSGSATKYSGEATPLVYDGVMFVVTGENNVSAIDVTTGDKIWEYVPHIAEKLDTVCCGWTSRGVALGDGKVYVGLLDARLVALDQKTGEVVWETEVAQWEEGYTITSAPLYYDGKVYTGVSGGEYGIRGRLTAYDADLGREIWRFYTIPGPEEVGHDTWPADNKAWLTGGAPVWQTPAVDPELNMIYFAAGNTSPDLDGSNREGDNLFSDSILALDATTGDYKWHFQEVHHDIWDLDPASPVILYDVEMDGEMKKGIAQAGKTGWVYFLDRTNGNPLVGIEEKEVPQNENQKTSPTQPYPKGDAFVPQTVTQEDVERDFPKEFNGKIGNIFTPFWDEPVTVRPSPQGGANWPPSAFNPDTEYFYVLGNVNYFSLNHEQSSQEFSEGDEYLGSVWQPVSNTPMGGTVSAIDVKTNKIVWQDKWDAIAYSGILTTKGNLVFAGHNDGRLLAYDAKTGDKLWEFMTNAGVNAPAMTYEVDGKQYISVYAAGNALAGSKHGDRIYTFSLDGTIESGEEIDVKEQQPEGTDKIEADGTEGTKHAGETTDIASGQTIFENNCLACHGKEGVGGHNGPNLRESLIAADRDKLSNQIKNGSGGMPPFEGVLSEDEIQSLADYILEKVVPQE